jgi:hypothetical protein
MGVLVFGLVGGLVAGLVVGLEGGLVVGLEGGLVFGLEGGLVFGLLFGLAGGLVFGFQDVLTADPDSNSTLNPTTSLHRNRSYGLAVGVVAGLGFGLMIGLLFGLAGGLVFGLFGFMVGPLGTESYPVSLASVQLAIEWRTPIRLMRFLHDAHSRNVLRTVGPSYQFRHARLQDRLAAVTSPCGGNAPTPGSKADSPLTTGTLQQENTATVSPDSGPGC